MDPTPKFPSASYEEIAVLIEVDAVWNAVVRFAMLVTEDSAVCETAVRCNVIHVNIVIFIVVEPLCIRRKRQPLG